MGNGSSGCPLTLKTDDVEASDGDFSSSCVDLSAVDDLCPVLENCRIRVQSQAQLRVLWVSKSYSDSTVTASICGTDPRRVDAVQLDNGELIIGAALSGATLRLHTPFNRLKDLRSKSNFSLASGSTEAVAKCSDGLDNDLDGLSDLVDPDCSSFADDSEVSAELLTAQLSNVAMTLDTADGKVYISKLSWKGKTIIVDDPAARFFLHSDAGGAGGKWTSDVQTFQGKDSGGQPIFPWQPNETTWKNQTSPTTIESNAVVKSVIVSQNDSVVVIKTTTPSVEIVDHIRFDVDPDSIYVTQSITNLLTANATIYTGLFLGNLQLGTTTTGCTCPAVLMSGLGDGASGHGQANNCSASCKSGLYHLDGLRRGSLQQGQPWDNINPITPCTNKSGPAQPGGYHNGCGGSSCIPPQETLGWRTVAARGNGYPNSIFSPATALGSTQDDWTVGMQLLEPTVNSDTGTDVQVEYYDIPAAPRRPLISQYIAVALVGGRSRSFTAAICFGTGGAWADARPAVAKVLQPYAKFFASHYGSTPAYCPSGAIAYAFESNCNKDSKTNECQNHTFNPGSSFYRDDLQIDKNLAVLKAAGMDKLIVWQGQIFSTLIMSSGKEYEFNPNSEILDPNLDQTCVPGPWTNVTNALGTVGAELGWFGRPCSHIMRTDDNTKSASMDCPSKKIHTGYPIDCDLNDPDQPCTAASMATVDVLVSKGVTSLYWDSYGCEGRMRFNQAVMKKYLLHCISLFILPLILQPFDNETSPSVQVSAPLHHGRARRRHRLYHDLRSAVDGHATWRVGSCVRYRTEPTAVTASLALPCMHNQALACAQNSCLQQHSLK